MPGLRLPLALLALALARQAIASTAADVPCQALSPPGQCVVGSAVTVSAGSILDFRPLALVVTSAGSLNAGGGAMSVKAGSVVLQPGSLLVSPGGRIDVTATDGIQVQEGSRTLAKVDASGPSGGSITFTAGGAVAVNGQLLVVAAVVLGDGGTIDVTGAAVSIGPNAKLSATGGRNGFGGDIAISSATGSTVIAGLLDTSAGNDGGYVAIDAYDDVTTAPTAVLNAKAGEGGSADSIDISAFTGKVSLAGTISVAAAGSLALGGGSGGDISVDAVGPITIDATIDVTGGGPGAFGGNVDVTTDGNILVRGPIDASAEGTGGYAGFVSFDSRTGQVDLQARVSAIGPVLGGDISAFSFNGISVSNQLIADGPSARVGLKGCGVAVTRDARLSSGGTNGQNVLQASGQLTIDGSVFGSVPGANRFEYLDSRKPPVYAPANVVPAPSIALNPMLFACGGPPTTTTTTSTTTTSASAATTTSTTITAPVTTTSTTTTSSTTTSSTAASTSTTTTSSTTRTTTTGSGASTTGTTVAPTTSTTTLTAPPSTPTTTTVPGASMPATTLPPGCGVGATLPCDAGTACDSVAGFDAVDCRLGLLDTTLVQTAAAELGGVGPQKKLRSRITGARQLVLKARTAPGRRGAKGLKKAAGKLNGLVRMVQKAEHRRKIEPSVGGPLVGLAQKTSAQLGRLQSAAP